MLLTRTLSTVYICRMLLRQCVLKFAKCMNEAKIAKDGERGGVTKEQRIELGDPWAGDRVYPGLGCSLLFCGSPLPDLIASLGTPEPAPAFPTLFSSLYQQVESSLTLGKD